GRQAGGDPADIAVNVAVDKVERRDLPRFERREERLPAGGAGDGQTAQVGGATRFAAGPLERVGALPLVVLVDDGTMPREAQLDLDRALLALDQDLFALDLHLGPGIANLVLGGIVRVRGLDEDVGLVGADDGDAPGDVVVVTQGDTGQGRFAGADAVPARRIQVHEIAQRRHGDGAMRVAGEHGFAGGGAGAIDDPVVARRR